MIHKSLRADVPFGAYPAQETVLVEKPSVEALLDCQAHVPQFAIEVH